MAIIVNANDIILQATSPRIEQVPLAGTFFIPGTTLIDGTSATTLRTNAANALATANAANAELASIASDNILSPGEKPAVVLDYNNLTNEHTSLDAQAAAFGITTERTNYNNAINALAAYLNTLTGWDTIPGSDVTIVGTTFRSKFADVYNTKQILLNKLADYASLTAQWTNVVSRPTNLTGLNSTEGTKLTGIAAGATVNNGIFANLAGQLTPSNYQTYLQNNTLSILGFSQNQTVSGSSIATGVTVDSDGQNVVVLFGGRLATSTLATPTGTETLNAQLTVGGVTKFNDQISRLAHLQISGEYQQSTTLQAILIPNPGNNPVSYALTLTISASQAGANNATCGWPTIQVIGLKR